MHCVEGDYVEKWYVKLLTVTSIKGNIEGKIVGTGRWRRRNCLLKHVINPLNGELNPIYNFLPLLGAHHILYVGRVRVKTVKCILPLLLILPRIEIYACVSSPAARSPWRQPKLAETGRTACMFRYRDVQYSNVWGFVGTVETTSVILMHWKNKLCLTYRTCRM